MTIRLGRLFEADGSATPLMFGLWRQKGALQALRPGVALIEQDRSGTRFFRSLWAVAFPTRDPLPFEAIAEPDGTGSEVFWERFV